MNNTMTLKAGMNAKIVMEVDMARELIQVRNSIFYDVSGRTIVLAQTDPPLSQSIIGGEATITYLVKEKEGPVRYGFPIHINDIIDDYKLVSSQFVKAVVGTRTGEPIPYSIRMFFRVEPTSKSGLEMSVYEKKVNILDISLGGVKISHRRSLRLEEGAVVELYFDIGLEIYNFHARVLRTWETDDERLRYELGFASLQFEDLPKRLEHVLSRKIRGIERESSRFGKDVE
jgi:hypothetical protein